jgi:hypothetical protein
LLFFYSVPLLLGIAGKGAGRVLLVEEERIGVLD